MKCQKSTYQVIGTFLMNLFKSLLLVSILKGDNRFIAKKIDEGLSS